MLSTKLKFALAGYALAGAIIASVALSPNRELSCSGMPDGRYCDTTCYTELASDPPCEDCSFVTIDNLECFDEMGGPGPEFYDWCEHEHDPYCTESCSKVKSDCAEWQQGGSELP